MRVRFTESVSGVYFDHRPGEEMEIGAAAGQLPAAQAEAWLASGTLVRVAEAVQSAANAPRESAVSRSRAEVRR